VLFDVVMCVCSGMEFLLYPLPVEGTLITVRLYYLSLPIQTLLMDMVLFPGFVDALHPVSFFLSILFL